LGCGVTQVHLTIAVDVDKLSGRIDLALHWHDIWLPDADAISIGSDLGQARWRNHVSKQARIAGFAPVIGPVEGNRIGDLAGLQVDVIAVNELHHACLQTLAAHLLQTARFETLNEHRRGPAIPPSRVERGDQLVLQREA